MTLRKFLASLALAAGTAIGASAADPVKPIELKPSALTFGRLAGLSPEAAKAKVDGYLTASGKMDRAKFDAIWSQNERTVLDRVVDSFAIAKPEIKTAMDSARDVVGTAPTDVPAVIKDEKDPFVKANVASAFARALAGKKVYEEALKASKGIAIEELVDPAAYFFFKAVAEHSLAGVQEVKGSIATRNDAINSIVKLLDDVAEAPDRYKMVATLMFFDIQNWAKDPKDLSNIAKLMDNSERRLDLARGGEHTQDIQKKIVFRLDEKIKELENQQKQSSSSNGGSCPSGGSPGDPNGINPNGPAKVSKLAQGGGPGNVDDKQLRKIAENWGTLPAAEREKLKRDIERDLPAKYKPMIEEYFKSLNKIHGYDK